MAIASASSDSMATRPSGTYRFAWSIMYYTNPDANAAGRNNRDLVLNVVGTRDGEPADAGTSTLTVRLADESVQTYDLTPYMNQGEQVFPNVQAKLLLSGGNGGKSTSTGFEIVDNPWFPPAT